jgi:hypothetical protein
MFKIFAATVLVATVVVACSTAPAVADTVSTPSLTYSQAVSELIFEANNVDEIFKANSQHSHVRRRPTLLGG